MRSTQKHAKESRGLNIGKWVASVAGAGSILIGLLSVFGFPGFAWFREKDYPTILLVVLTGFILEALAWITNRMAKMDAYLRGGITGQIDQARHDIDPRLQKLVGGEVGKFLDRVNKLLTESSFELNNVEDFRGFYVKTLRNYPGREFLATSIPSKKFFWRDDEVEAAIAQFINEGGKMTRIFFLNSDDQLEDPAVRRVLDRQAEIKVNVFYVNVKEISPDLTRVFMVEKQGEIAWEVIFRRSDETITSVSVIAGIEHTEDYLRDFEILSPQPCVHRYQRSTHFDPHGDAVAAPDLDAFRDFEQTQWEKGAAQYDRYFGQLTRHTHTALLTAADVSPGSRVLDLTCGFGHLAADASRLGARVVGLDFSAHMLNKAHLDNPNVAFVQAYAEQLPFKSESFDAALINYGMLHLARPKACLAETFRILRKGGRLAFTVWAGPVEHCGLAAILNAIGMYNSPQYTLPGGPPFFDFGNDSKARAAVAAAGFEVILTNSFSLIWDLSSKLEFFEAFYTGTARIGSTLRSQNEGALAKIKAAVMNNASEFLDGNGTLHVPMPTLLICAAKPKQ